MSAAKQQGLADKIRCFGGEVQQLEREHSWEERITQVEETNEELEESEQILEVTVSQVDRTRGYLLQEGGGN